MNKIERQSYIDWLRVLGMLVVFLYHNARFFDETGWCVKNVELSFGMSVFVGITSQFIMPLFFLLSAFAVYFALKKRANVEFIRERVHRLFVPLVVGVFTHIPFQVYIENITRNKFRGSFWQFIPHYFDGWYGFGGNFAWMGLHLWYLLALFLFSLLLLPLFQYLNRTIGVASYLVNVTSKFFGLYFFVIPIFIMEWLVSLSPETVGRRDFGGWSALTYLIFFVSGYVLAMDTRRFRTTIQNMRFISLFLSLLTVIVGYVLIVELDFPQDSLLFLIVRSVNSWSWLLTFLGFAGLYLNISNRFLKYANEAVLPFYIMHQTVIVILGYFIINWKLAILPKYIFLVVISFIIIMALYEFAIRRITAMRYLFGMKG